MPPWEDSCTDVYHYEEYGGDIIDTLYGHIFGNIHCGCGPELSCAECGNGSVEEYEGEECDAGSRCDDWGIVSGTGVNTVRSGTSCT